MAQRSTLRHAQQENKEVRDDRALSYLIAMEVEPFNFQAQCSREFFFNSIFNHYIHSVKIQKILISNKGPNYRYSK